MAGIIKGEELFMGKILPEVGQHFLAAAKDCNNPHVKRDLGILSGAFHHYGELVRLGGANRTHADGLRMDNLREEIENVTKRIQRLDPTMTTVVKGAEEIVNKARQTFKSSSAQPQPPA